MGLSSDCFVLFLLKWVVEWVWAGSCALGENVTPSTHRLAVYLSPYSLCVSYTTYVGKSDHVSQLSQLCQRLCQFKSFCVFCISAWRTCCTDSVLWCGTNIGKYHFTHKKWSKGSECIWTDIASTLQLCCGGLILQGKCRDAQQLESILNYYFWNEGKVEMEKTCTLASDILVQFLCK